MFGIHRHQYPPMWKTIAVDQKQGGVLQEKACATCGKIKRVMRMPSW